MSSVGAEPAPLAECQLAIHEERLREYEQIAGAMTDETPQGIRLSLEAGIGHEREWVRFWRRLAHG